MKIKLLIFFLLIYGPSEGQEKSQSKRMAYAVKTYSPVKIDGSLQDSVWKTAPAASHFKQLEPKPGSNAHYLTEVRTAYDADHIYFAITAHDSIGTGRYKAPDLKRDFNFQNHDLVGIAIDGFNDGRNSMTFFVNAYGAQRDYLSFDDSYFDVDWNGIWEVKTARTDSCWTAEIAIPWKTLRYEFDPGKPHQFGINFQRVRRKTNERSVWSPYPRGVGFNRMEYAGTISGLVPPTPSTNIQLNPYTLVSRNSGYGNKLKFGGELKWAITPNLVADATVNTDFAQADVDQQVNNLTRFSVLFPEKRQFFLENASLFGAGMYGDEASNGNVSLIPFFSRRVGLDMENRPVPLQYGGRIVSRSIKRNYGAMFIQQQENELNPKNLYFVGRYSENFGKYNRLGLVTASTFENGTVHNSNERAHTLAADGLIRIDPNNLLTGMLALTTSNKNSNGMAGYLKYQLTNPKVNAWLTAAVIGEHFNPRSGFISRSNIFAVMPGAQLNLRKGWLPFRNLLRDFVPGVSGEIYYQASTGAKLEQNIKLTPLAYNFIKGGRINLSYLYSYQHIITDFRPLGVPISLGSYENDRIHFEAFSDGSKALSYGLTVESGEFFNGSLTSLDASMTLAPIPYLSVGTGLNTNRIRGVGVSETTRTINLYTLESRIAASPKLQLYLTYQKNTSDGSSVSNARFSWEYRPLSFIHLVYSGRGTVDPLTTRDQGTILKISLLKQL